MLLPNVVGFEAAKAGVEGRVVSLEANGEPVAIGDAAAAAKPDEEEPKLAKPPPFPGAAALDEVAPNGPDDVAADGKEGLPNEDCPNAGAAVLLDPPNADDWPNAGAKGPDLPNAADEELPKAGGEEKEVLPKAGAPKAGALGVGVAKGDDEVWAAGAGVEAPDMGAEGALAGAAAARGAVVGAPASSCVTTSLAAPIPAYCPPNLLRIRHPESVPSVPYDHRIGVACSPALSSASGASVAVRSTSRPRGKASKGRVVKRSFRTCDHTRLLPPSSVGPCPTCPTVLLVELQTSSRCLKGVQFLSQTFLRYSGRSGFSTINGSGMGA